MCHYELNIKLNTRFTQKNSNESKIIDRKIVFVYHDNRNKFFQLPT
jgi:hypothetical protein